MDLTEEKKLVLFFTWKLSVNWSLFRIPGQLPQFIFGLKTRKSEKVFAKFKILALSYII